MNKVKNYHSLSRSKLTVMIKSLNYKLCFFYRYEYDDHYFLTDPKEFIYEFFPLQSEWQLLKNPITLEEFEELPFVRSLFFRYQLSFPSDNMKSVMRTDSTGMIYIMMYYLSKNVCLIVLHFIGLWFIKLYFVFLSG